MAPVVDILVLGGGPAGLTAATTLVRQYHTAVVLDAGKYRNDKTYHMHTLPTWDHKHPEEFRAKARADLDRYNTVDVQKTEVASVKKTEDGLFEATSKDGQTWSGRKLILASGVEDIYPDIDGYAECWVEAIFHCLYCHGWEEKGNKSSGILAVGDVSAVIPVLHFARQGLRMTPEVTVYTHGNIKLAEDLTAELKSTPQIHVDARKIRKFVKGPERAQIVIQFEDGSDKTEGFLAHKPQTKLKGPFAQQLGLELTPMGDIAVKPPFSQTSVPGCFAAGDCVSPMKTMAQAVYSGCATGAGAPSQLQAELLGHKGFF